MDFDAVRADVAAYPATRMIEANGDVFAIYDPDRDYEQRPRQGWATIVSSDVNDTASDLDRPGVYRLNIGLPKATYDGLFDAEAQHDHTAFDVVMPHPVYSGYHWACVLNPETTWAQVRELLDDAHDFAARKHENTRSRRER